MHGLLNTLGFEKLTPEELEAKQEAERRIEDSKRNTEADRRRNMEADRRRKHEEMMMKERQRRRSIDDDDDETHEKKGWPGIKAKAELDKMHKLRQELQSMSKLHSTLISEVESGKRDRDDDGIKQIEMSMDKARANIEEMRRSGLEGRKSKEEATEAKAEL